MHSSYNHVALLMGLKGEVRAPHLLIPILQSFKFFIVVGMKGQVSSETLHGYLSLNQAYTTLSVVSGRVERGNCMTQFSSSPILPTFSPKLKETKVYFLPKQPRQCLEPTRMAPTPLTHLGLVG